MREVLVAILVLAADCGAHAQGQQGQGPGFFDGNRLHRACNDKERQFNNGACFGYVIAITDALSSNGAINGIRACIPANIAAQQVRDIIVSYLDRNPQNRHFTAASLGAYALVQAFPCP